MGYDNYAKKFNPVFFFSFYHVLFYFPKQASCDVRSSSAHIGNAIRFPRNLGKTSLAGSLIVHWGTRRNTIRRSCHVEAVTLCYIYTSPTDAFPFPFWGRFFGVCGVAVPLLSIYDCSWRLGFPRAAGYAFPSDNLYIPYCSTL